MAKKQQQWVMKGRSVGGGGPAPFLVKTHEMVEEKGTEEVISWGERGESFVVWKPVEFARDLLPNYFKHCNFSSFVRQLNTYGFRKVVPDRWEFANDNFRRGERALLSEIRRRKSTGAGCPLSSSLNSGEVHSPSSSSSSAPQAKQQQLLELSTENEKLKNDNRLLCTELALAKKHCEELLGVLSEYADVSQLNISLLAKEKWEGEENKEGDDDDDEEEAQECLKLFGVTMRRCEGEKKEKKKLKRGRCEERDGGRPTKMMGFGVPWMRLSPPESGGSKVCN